MRNLRHRNWENMNSTPATRIPTSLYQQLTSPFHPQHRIWIIFFLSHTQQSSFLHTISSSKHSIQIHRQITNCNTKTDDDDKIRKCTDIIRKRRMLTTQHFDATLQLSLTHTIPANKLHRALFWLCKDSLNFHIKAQDLCHIKRIFPSYRKS